MKQGVLHLSPETKDTLKKLLREQINEYRNKIVRLEKDLILLDEEPHNSEPIIVNTIVKQENKNWKFKEAILHLLEDGVPKTSRDLLNAFNLLTDKNLEMGGFSAQLSPLAKDGTEIKKDYFEDYPYDSRTYYGLSSWFDGGKLKPSYKSKIKKPQS